MVTRLSNLQVQIMLTHKIYEPWTMIPKGFIGSVYNTILYFHSLLFSFLWANFSSGLFFSYRKALKACILFWSTDNYANKAIGNSIVQHLHLQSLCITSKHDRQERSSIWSVAHERIVNLNNARERNNEHNADNLMMMVMMMMNTNYNYA